MENTLNIPFFTVIRFFLGYESHWAHWFIRYNIPFIFSILFVIDFGDWIVNGETNTDVQGQRYIMRQSHIIAILSYMNSQFSFLLATGIFFGFMLKSRHLILAVEEMVSAHLFCFGLKVTKRSPVMLTGYGLIFVSALIYAVVTVVQLWTNIVTTKSNEIWKPNPYFVWKVPTTLWDVCYRLVWLTARLLPFLIYVLYFHLVVIAIQAVMKFNVRLKNSIIGVQQGILQFEEVLKLLRKEDEEISAIIHHISEGFSFVLGAGIFGHFLLICSLSAQAFITDDFINVWEYAREVLTIIPSAVVLLIFFITGSKLHECCTQTIVSFRDLILTHQDCRTKVPIWTDDAKLITFLYKISQRSGSLMVAGFAHLTRGTAATFIFAFVGYLCFLIERSEHFKTDEKLAGALNGNSTMSITLS